MACEQILEPCAPVHLGDFFLEDRRHPAVYFLFDRGVVVYVGQTRTLRFRIDAHMAEGKKRFDAVAFIRCTTDQLLRIESRYIRKLVPRYNDCLIAKAVRVKEPWKAPPSQSYQFGVEQAAQFLGVPTEQIIAWRSEGFLPSSLRSRRGRAREECWSWSLSCLVAFRDRGFTRLSGVSKERCTEAGKAEAKATKVA
jgi:hypothetical protein